MTQPVPPAATPGVIHDADPGAPGWPAPPAGGEFAAPPRGQRRRRFALPMRLLPALPLVPLAAAAAWVQVYNPTDNRADPTGPCAWHAVTGINGPTCGGTRAFYELLHGNLVETARYHLPFVVAVPFLAYWWLAWVVELWFGRRLPRLRLRPWMIITYVAASLVFTTVLRNLAVPGLSWFDIPNLTHRTT
jgi:hypothetical protein